MLVFTSAWTKIYFKNNWVLRFISCAIFDHLPAAVSYWLHHRGRSWADMLFISCRTFLRLWASEPRPPHQDGVSHPARRRFISLSLWCRSLCSSVRFVPSESFFLFLIRFSSAIDTAASPQRPLNQTINSPCLSPTWVGTQMHFSVSERTLHPAPRLPWRTVPSASPQSRAPWTWT